MFFSEHNRFEDLLPAMFRRPQEKYLLVLSDIHTDDQINMFAEHNITVQPAIMYRTVSSKWEEQKPFDYDMIALFTPSGVKSIQENFPNWQQGKTLIAAFGAGTVQALEEAGYRVDIRVPNEKHQSIISAINDYLEHQTEE